MTLTTTSAIVEIYAGSKGRPMSAFGEETTLSQIGRMIALLIPRATSSGSKGLGINVSGS
jgi:hypothetical protein